MDLTDEDIAHILRLIDEAPYEELEIEWKGLVVRVSRRGESTAPAPSARAPRGHPATEKLPQKEAPTRAAAAVPKGSLVVTAPVMGTFYRRPEPGKPPFAEVGAAVREDDTLCLIEVMKVFTAVKAGADGTVAAILAEDVQLVEFGQALFAIRPAGS